MNDKIEVKKTVHVTVQMEGMVFDFWTKQAIQFLDYMKSIAEEVSATGAKE